MFTLPLGLPRLRFGAAAPSGAAAGTPGGSPQCGKAPGAPRPSPSRVREPSARRRFTRGGVGLTSGSSRPFVRIPTPRLVSSYTARPPTPPDVGRSSASRTRRRRSSRARLYRSRDGGTFRSRETVPPEGREGRRTE